MDDANKKKKRKGLVTIFQIGKGFEVLAPLYTDDSIDVEGLIEDARERYSYLQMEQRRTARIALVASLAAVVIAGYVGFQFGENRAWALAEVRAKRVWASGVCRGVASGAANLAVQMLGEEGSSSIYFEGWRDTALRLGNVAYAGYQARNSRDSTTIAYFIELVPELTVADVLEYTREQLLEDPALERRDLPTPTELGLSPKKERDMHTYENALACTFARLDPDEIRTGEHPRSPSFPPPGELIGQ